MYKLVDQEDEPMFFSPLPVLYAVLPACAQVVRRFFSRRAVGVPDA